MHDKLSYDWRDIEHGCIIPSENYTDQPYIVKTDDNAWLCTLTTGCGDEGQKGQHVVTMRSLDKGVTWHDRWALEPSDGPESAYAVLLKLSTGRIFAFYAYNSQNIREVPADPGPTFNGVCKRVDCLGDFVFRYSDDHGRSWSKDRFVIDVREMAIDRANVFGGKVRFFWNVGKPFFYDNSAYVPLIKVGGFGEGCYTRTEGVLLKCADIMSSDNPAAFKWETLPDGDVGLKTPPGGGPIAEEQSYSILSDGSFFCVYRTIDGHPACTYSRDGGHTWSIPEYMKYSDGRLIKNPRAANFAWKCSNGKFLYWFHNHGYVDFSGRNPAWVCSGIEVDSPSGRIIEWNQPEILLYDKDPDTGMSYPDLIEDDGLYITETQKSIARVHKIDDHFLDMLWNASGRKNIVSDNCLLDYRKISAAEEQIDMPSLPEFITGNNNDTNAGFSIEFTVNASMFSPHTMLLDARTSDGVGSAVMIGTSNNVEIVLNDGSIESKCLSDPDTLTSDIMHHIMIIIDGGPRIVSFIIDGKFNDGGMFRQYGWSRFEPLLKHVNGSNSLYINQDIKNVRIYSRALMTCEAVGNFNVWGGC